MAMANFRNSNDLSSTEQSSHGRTQEDQRATVDITETEAFDQCTLSATILHSRHAYDIVSL